jgi:hypothetical protein
LSDEKIMTSSRDVGAPAKQGQRENPSASGSPVLAKAARRRLISRAASLSAAFSAAPPRRG